MHARHHDIEGVEDIGRVVQRSVGEDVRVDALEDLETAAEIFIERIDQSVLAEDVVYGQPTRIVCRRRVVGDAQVLISKIAGGFGHLAKGVRPVGEIGVDVEYAFEVLFLDELRQCERLGIIDFVSTLAQFRWDVRQSETPVDRLFRPPRRLSAWFAEAVRTEDQALAARDGLQLLKVPPVAGGVKQRASECRRCGNVHLNCSQALRQVSRLLLRLPPVSARKPIHSPAGSLRRGSRRQIPEF